MTDAEKITLLRKRLTEAVAAIGSLPEDIFGIGGGTGPGQTHWWIRDEMKAIWEKAIEDTRP